MNLENITRRLHPFQQDVVEEALLHKSGALCLCMGSGKTLISLVVALKQTDKPILVVCAKTLVHSWVHEIQKFFVVPDSLTHTLVDCRRPQIYFDARVVITTPDLLAKQYKKLELEKKFVTRVPIPTVYGGELGYKIVYNYVERPLVEQNTGSSCHAVQWGAVIVDEAHTYLNIDTARSRAIASLSADHFWLLSGTLFDEPDVTKILGFFMFLHLDCVPYCRPDLVEYLKDANRTASIKAHSVVRQKNLMMDSLECKCLEHVVVHPLKQHEVRVYMALKRLITDVWQRIQQLKAQGLNIQKMGGALLGMITYLRQSLVCPMSVLANVVVMATTADNGPLREVVRASCFELYRDAKRFWDLDDVNSVRSSRLDLCLELVAKHPTERVVVFSAFQSLLNLVEHFADKERKLFRMHSSQSSAERQKLVEQFGQSENGVLLMTFKLGAMGLNLQQASVCVILDFWWNAGMTDQAISRVMRYGQTRDVSVYYLSANSAFELELFRVHLEKKQIGQKLMQQEVLETFERKTKSRFTFDKIMEVVQRREVFEPLSQLYANAQLQVGANNNQTEEAEEVDAVKEEQAKNSDPDEANGGGDFAQTGIRPWQRPGNRRARARAPRRGRDVAAPRGGGDVVGQRRGRGGGRLREEGAAEPRGRGRALPQVAAGGRGDAAQTEDQPGEADGA